MRLSAHDHLVHPWQVHGLADDFDLLDVWRFPLIAHPEKGETFAVVQRFFLQQLEHPDDFQGVTGWLFTLRKKMGETFGWDEKQVARPIPGCTETSVKDRLSTNEPPATPTLEVHDTAVFTPVYAEDTEVLYETSNDTVHALLHLGWVPAKDESFTVQMAVYAKSRGWLGHAYMAAISPFRHWIVYPTMMQWLKRHWQSYRKTL